MPISKISMAEIVASTSKTIYVTTPLISTSTTQFGQIMVTKLDWTAPNVDVVPIQRLFTMFHTPLDLPLPLRLTSLFESENETVWKVWNKIFHC